jgi:8-oxo-dGTP pyrophosphatase MutT (NUDIX family)
MAEQKQSLPHCAGVIVFKQEVNTGQWYTVLVATPRGNLGFPKGKRHRGEPLQHTAWRELQEETGISETDITLIVDPTTQTPVTLDEIKPTSKHQSPSVRYYVGIYNGTWPCPVKCEDPTELSCVEWTAVGPNHNMPQQLSLLRQTILTKAFAHIFMMSETLVYTTM